MKNKELRSISHKFAVDMLLKFEIWRLPAGNARICKIKGRLEC